MRDRATAREPVAHWSESRRRTGSTAGQPPVNRPSLHAPESVLGGPSAGLAVRIADAPQGPLDSRCVPAIAATVDEPGVGARLQQVRRQLPTTPVVIVTSAEYANLIRLARLNAEVVVPAERMEDEFASVVRGLQRHSPLDVAAAAFEALGSLDAVARAAILAALRSLPPIRTVKALARCLGVSRKRLWAGFRPVQICTGWSSLDLLHAVALWRVIELARRSGGGVQRAWRELGLSDSTARRTCQAHLGCAPSKLLDHADALEHALLGFAERCLVEDGAGTD